MAVAQPWPQVGSVIPDAVETPQGADPFVYADDCQPGMIMQEGFGTLAHALDRQVLTGRISPEQAKISWANSGKKDGDYTPPAGPQG